MKIGSHFRPLTFALAAFALPLTASAQISVSGDLSPLESDPFWTNGGNGSTNGFIGVTGVGELTVQGSSVLTLFNGVLGQQSGSVGNATVSGANAEWNMTGVLIVGADGTGSLGVSNGALVTNNSSNIAEGIGSEGTVTVNNASWTTQLLQVGRSGTGILNVENGAVVTSNNLTFIGRNATGLGTATVTGTGSIWNSGTALTVGSFGSGTLTVANDGQVNADAGANQISLATEAGSTGTLNIGNGGTAGVVKTGTVQGGAGTGVLNYNHSDSDYFFTDDTTSSGTAIAIAGNVDVNHLGTGSTAIVGDSTFSGNITVEDGTMTFTNGSTTTTTGNNDDLVIGSVAGKTGTVIINNGATVNIGTDLELGSTVAGGTGDLLVTGAGTKLVVGTGSGSSAGDADIGDDGGSGTLTVSNGAEVQFNRTVEVATDGGQGKVTVTGTGSKFSAVRTIVVDGENGPGRFEVLDGGFVRADGAFELGENEDDSLGELLISGVDSFGNASRVEATTRTDLGTTGGGSITVEAGGQFVSSGNISIHDNNDSSSSVTVTGAGSLFSTVGLTQLGRFGSGTLTVADGGVYEVDGGSGTIEMGGGSGNGNGVLNIGAGGAAGHVNVAVVTTNTAVGNIGTLNFNHNETDYQFTTDGTSTGTAVQIAGQTDVNHIGTGTTSIVGDSTFSGEITVEDGTLVFTNGSTTTTTGTADNLVIGTTAGKTGTVIINNGATVDIGHDLDVAETVSGGTGDLQVTGAGTQLNVGTSGGQFAGIVDIGVNAGSRGTMTISDGATVQINDALYIAYSGAEGLVTVTGTDSMLTTGDEITIDGENGPGRLEVLDGGFVRADGGFDIGESENESFGELLISGVDSFGNASRVVSGEGINMGTNGGGNITVAAGGQLEVTGDIDVSNDRGLTSSINVTGAGSKLTTTETTELGRGGNGILTVADGGVYEVGSGAGRIEIGGNGINTDREGTVNIGDGGAAGVLSVGVVTTNSGANRTGTINFNHTETDYQFTNDGTSGGTAISIEGQTSVRQIGTGTTTVSGNNSYTGGTTIEDGTLRLGSSTAAGTGTILIDGGTLDINGQTVDNAVSFGTDGGVLTGSGTVNASVSLTSTNDVLAPGDSPGITVYGANQTWESFTYLWELNDWQLQIAGTTFDQLQIDGSLELTGSALDSYDLDITSLTALDEPGNVANFSRIDRTWIIITTTDGITGFDENYWSILTSNFSSQPGIRGSFSLSQEGNDLVLTYTVPEPTTGALLLAGLGYMALRRRR